MQSTEVSVLNNYLSIGEVSKLKNISVKTLRFYEEIGLLKPAFINPVNKYRYYSFDQMIYIEYINFYKSSGASLKEIIEFCSDDDVDRITQFLEKQLIAANEKIKALQECCRKFNYIKSEIVHDTQRKNKEDLYFRDMEERTGISYECLTHPTDENTYKTYFKAFKDIKENQLFSYYPTGSIVELNESRNGLIYKRMFIGAETTGKTDIINLYAIPKGRYLCVNYYEDNKKSQIEKIARELERHNIAPKIAVEADTFVNVTKYENPMMELQILID